jgi:hypothetical protein
MPSETRRQKQTVARAMHKLKHGELQSGEGGSGGTVKSPGQAIAIALSEAGASSARTPAENKHARARSRAKEGTGEPARALAEGDAPDEPSFAQLVKKARVLGVPGRSRMTKDQLVRALRRH